MKVKHLLKNKGIKFSLILNKKWPTQSSKHLQKRCLSI
jgi:hypothetical protein